MAADSPTTPNDALDLLLQWPLVLIVLDGYEPESAAAILKQVVKLGDEHHRTVLRAYGLRGNHFGPSLLN